MKVLGSIEWRVFSSGCREVVRLQVHTGWRMERFDKHQDTNEVHDSVQGPISNMRCYKAKYVKTRCLQKAAGHLEPTFQGEGVIPEEYFLVSTKLDTFCYLTVQTAACYVPSF